jgi:uncharacterized protein
VKYLLLLAVVVVFIWHWRATRRAEIAQLKSKVHPAPTPASGPVDMVQCAHCHVHLAQSDAVAGRRGRYCSADHRAMAEA